MSIICRSIGCTSRIHSGSDFCIDCESGVQKQEDEAKQPQSHFDFEQTESLSEVSHFQLKPLNGVTQIDVFAVHQLFAIQDPSGCIQEASKTLLLSSTRGNKKPLGQDIRKAKDMLTRWLQINEGASKI